MLSVWSVLLRFSPYLCALLLAEDADACGLVHQVHRSLHLQDPGGNEKGAARVHYNRQTLNSPMAAFNSEAQAAQPGAMGSPRTLFTFCPPAPLARANLTSMSLGLICGVGSSQIALACLSWTCCCPTLNICARQHPCSMHLPLPPAPYLHIHVIYFRHDGHCSSGRVHTPCRLRRRHTLHAMHTRLPLELGVNGVTHDLEAQSEGGGDGARDEEGGSSGLAAGQGRGWRHFPA